MNDLSAELAAAKSRIGELEQERERHLEDLRRKGDINLHLLDEKISLQTQLAAVIQNGELLAKELSDMRDKVRELDHQLATVTQAFKNFHNNLCKRFDYGHDEIDWQRDQASLEEHIARQIQELTRQRNEQIVAARELAKAVTSMDKRLAAVTLDRDTLSDELDSFKSENESFRAECVPLRNTVAQLQAHNKRLRDALEELCGGIEDGGGTDGNGDTFDLTKAIAALTEEEKP